MPAGFARGGCGQLAAKLGHHICKPRDLLRHHGVETRHERRINHSLGAVRRGDHAIAIDHPVVAYGVAAVAGRHSKSIHVGGKADVSGRPASAVLCKSHGAVSNGPAHLGIGKLHFRPTANVRTRELMPGLPAIVAGIKSPVADAQEAGVLIEKKYFAFFASLIRECERHSPSRPAVQGLGEDRCVPVIRHRVTDLRRRKVQALKRTGHVLGKSAGLQTDSAHKHRLPGLATIHGPQDLVGRGHKPHTWRREGVVVEVAVEVAGHLPILAVHGAQKFFFPLPHPAMARVSKTYVAIGLVI